MPESPPPSPPGTTVPPRLRLPHGAFGTDRFGIAAERFARFFGTPRFILGQTLVVVLWITLNAVAFGLDWDPYPFILLNLAFSTQAAYAAPLILLAQTRQADRDKAADADQEAHRARVEVRQLAADGRLQRLAEAEEAALAEHRRLLEANTELTQRVVTLTEALHRHLLPAAD